ncbi:MAG: GDSL-type esterase/lipase family protein [Bacteroidales bacterium]|nr:GDSL-type esterase/lipase family protein [Bacteroidales bacterium]
MKTKMVLSVLLFFSLFASAQADWVHSERFAAKNKQIVKPVTAVFMGNSITENWFKMDSAFFQTNNFQGRGIGGQTTSHMLIRFRPDVINLKPKAVVILAGTNDIAQNMGYFSHENIMNNLISMCELAKANNIKVFLCAIMPASKYPWKPAITDAAVQIKKVNEMIKAYCAKGGATFVDFYTPFVDEVGGLPKTFAGDGVHPNLNCYKIMEEIVMKNLSPLSTQPTQIKAAAVKK